LGWLIVGGIIFLNVNEGCSMEVFFDVVRVSAWLFEFLF
jgi:hypothetical protein